MSKLVVGIVIGTFLLDMVLTYHYVKEFKQMYPKNDWTQAEANPIIRNCMKYLGLEKGMIVGSIIVLIILGIILRLLNINGHYFLMGFYVCVNIHHFVNWMSLKRLRQMKGGKNRNGKK